MSWFTSLDYLVCRPYLPILCTTFLLTSMFCAWTKSANSPMICPTMLQCAFTLSWEGILFERYYTPSNCFLLSYSPILWITVIWPPLPIYYHHIVLWHSLTLYIWEMLFTPHNNLQPSYNTSIKPDCGVGLYLLLIIWGDFSTGSVCVFTKAFTTSQKVFFLPKSIYFHHIFHCEETINMLCRPYYIQIWQNIHRLPNGIPVFPV